MIVTPSAWNSVPPLMLEIRKCVTSAPSLACRSRTIAPDWVSSTVTKPGTIGVSPTGVIVIVEVATPDCAATVVPSCDDSTLKEPGAVAFAGGKEGLTRGPYTLIRPVEDGEPEVLGRGQYLSLWRFEDGRFKVYLDTGAPDPPEAELLD